jgi:hypothetical protein
MPRAIHLSDIGNGVRAPRVALLAFATMACALALVYGLRGPFAVSSAAAESFTHATALAHSSDTDAPAHSVLIAGLIRAGMSFATAASILPVLLLILPVALVACSRLPVPMAFGLVTGLFTAAFLWTSVPLTATGVAAAVALVGALCAAEASRSHAWARLPFACSGGLTVLAVALAPWTAGILLTPFVYVALAVREQRDHVAGVAAALLSGGLVVVLVLVSIGGDGWIHQATDEWRRIIDGASVTTAFRRHLLGYSWIPIGIAEDANVRPAMALLLWPAAALRVPLGVWALAVLLAFRSSRALAIAAVPPLMSIALLSVSSESAGEAGYIPEVALYLAAMVMVVLTAAMRVIAMLQPAQTERGLAVVALTGGLIVLQAVPRTMGVRWDFTSGPAFADLQRAATEQLLGPSRVIALLDQRAWYVSGGSVIWDAFREVSRTRADDFRDLFEDVDAVVLTNNDLSGTVGETLLADWFEDDGLDLSGLVIVSDAEERVSGVELLLSPVSRPARAFMVRGDEVQQFTARAGGPALLATAECLWGASPLDPDGRAFDARIPIGPETTGRALLVAAGERKAMDALFSNLDPRCVAREQITGVLEESFVSLEPGAGTPVSMMDERSDALAFSGRKESRPQPTVAVAATIDWAQLALANRTSPTATSALPLEVIMPAEPWAYGAVVPVRRSGDTSQGELVFAIKARVHSGEAGFGVLNASEDDFVARAPMRAHFETQVLELRIPDAARIGRFVIQNWESGGSTEVRLEEIAILGPAR